MIDVRARRRKCFEPRGIDRLAGHLVDAIRAVVETLERGFDLGELLLEPLENGHILLAFERLRRLVRGMLVVVRELTDLRGFLFVEPFVAQARDQPSDAIVFMHEPCPRLCFVEALCHAAQGYPSLAGPSLADVP